jgi:hypothetical protein
MKFFSIFSRSYSKQTCHNFFRPSIGALIRFEIPSKIKPWQKREKGGRGERGLNQLCIM